MSMSTQELELELQMCSQELELELQICFESRYPTRVCCCEVMNRATISQKKQWFENRKVAEICVSCRLLIEGEIYNEPRIKNIVIKNLN